MDKLVRTFPLYLVQNPDMGLLGARVRAQRCLGVTLKKTIRKSTPHVQTRQISGLTSFFA